MSLLLGPDQQVIYFSLYLVEVGGVVVESQELCVSGEDPGPERRETARQERDEAFECEYFKHFKGRHLTFEIRCPFCDWKGAVLSP